MSADKLNGTAGYIEEGVSRYSGLGPRLGEHLERYRDHECQGKTEHTLE